MRASSWRTPAAVLFCGGMILTIALGVRHNFGLYLQPITADLGIGRETFAFAIAIQNLLYGISQPITGLIADRFGTARVLIGGAILYAIGLCLMSVSSTGLELTLSAGLLIGASLGCSGFSIVFGVIGRSFPPDKRSVALGIAGAAGSFGQFAMLPMALVLISVYGWHATLLGWVVVATAMVPLGYGIRDIGYHGQPPSAGIGMKEAFSEACANKGFWLLSFGYFTCGFQIVFIGTHFPSFLLDKGLTARDGTVALALIGLFNIAGSFLAGWLGDRFPRASLLAGLYAVRGFLLAGILLLPTTPLVAYLFAALFGLTWLGTVPLTNGVVAGMFADKARGLIADGVGKVILGGLILRIIGDGDLAGGGVGHGLSREYSRKGANQKRQRSGLKLGPRPAWPTRGRGRRRGRGAC